MYDQGQLKSNALMSGQQTAGIAQAVPKAPAAQEIVSRLETLNGILRDVIICQRNLLERLHGPSPTSDSVGKSANVSPSGYLNTIEERLNWLMQTSQEIVSNQQTLDRLA